MKTKTILGLVLLAGFGGLLFVNFGNQVGGYMTFSEATGSGTKAHVVGTWVEDEPMHYDRTANVFTFHMRDQSGAVRKVRYNSPKPANFEEAEQLVVEGYARSAEQPFAAEHILVKCPSKYNDAKGLDGTQAAANRPSEAQP
jgi:cytochrome c-type biogenesis protein CcmE